MDIGAFIIERLDSDLHHVTATEARRYLADTGQAREGAYLAYGMCPEMPSAIVMSVSVGEHPSVLAWHREHQELGARLAQALGCRLWLVLRERRSWWTEVRTFQASGRVSSGQAEEGDKPIKAVARQLAVPPDILESLLESPNGPGQRLADDDDDGQLLVAPIAALMADERARHPGCERLVAYLPMTIVEELRAVAQRLSLDLSSVFWAAWEWAKPESYRAFVDERGKRRKATQQPPLGIAPGAPPKQRDELPMGGQRIKATLWIPPRLAREITGLSEFCERGVASPTPTSFLAIGF